jgi:hypothetical protein
MATKRLSEGVYEVNGKRVNAKNAAEAEKKAGGGKKEKESAGSDTGIKLDKAQQKVKKDVEGGQNLNNVLGLTKPLSRISTDTPDDQKAFIESLKSLSDPNSEAFVGKRSDEEKGVVDSLKGLFDSAGEKSPEETKALGSLEEILNSAGKRSGDTTDLLATLKNRAATAGNRSAEMADTLNLMKSGLAGLNASENTALREQAQKEVDRKYQAAVDNIQKAAQASGMRGGNVAAGMRNARRDAMGAQGDLEQKNLLANIDVQDRRRNDYANTLSGAEAAEFGRGTTALDAYGNTLGNTEGREFDQKSSAANNYASGVNDFTNNRFNRMNTAAGNWGNTVTSLGNNERGRVSDALNNYGAGLTDRNNYFLDTSKVNLGQERTDRAAETASSLGLAGLAENERARRRALKQQKRRSGGTGDGRTAPTNATTTPGQYGGFNSAADQEYYNTISSIYNQ